nr:hypothetical protein [Tanacetum cinerariifolium]
MMNPFPNVESARSLIQQEESQRVLFGSSSNVETTALYSRGNVKDKCRIWNISFTPQQFEKLLRSVQQFGSITGSKEEIDHHYAAGIVYLNIQIDVLELLEDWIYDTGASDHMTPVHEYDLTTRKVKGLGKLKDRLYHLMNVSSDKVDSVFTSLVQTTLQKFACTAVNKGVSDTYAL